MNPLPPPSPQHPSGSSPCTSPKHAVSCIRHRLVIRFLHDSIHVSMPFSQIIPPSASPSESQSPPYTSVSFSLSCIQGHHCHLSKFHICVSILYWCFSFWLTSLCIIGSSFIHLSLSFPSGSVVKNSPAMQEPQETRVQSLGWEGPWKSRWQPTLVFLPGKSHGQRSLGGYSPWGYKELETTEWLHFRFNLLEFYRGFLCQNF